MALSNNKNLLAFAHLIKDKQFWRTKRLINTNKISPSPDQGTE